MASPQHEHGHTWPISPREDGRRTSTAYTAGPEIISATRKNIDSPRLTGSQVKARVSVKAVPGAETSLLGEEQNVGIEGSAAASNTKIRKSRWKRMRLGIRKLFKGTPHEEKKAVVEKTFLGALGQSTVHLIPILATIVLAYLNISGYFIGGSYHGVQGAAQAFDTLCLQVTAKLMELLTVASLANIVLSMVRRELVFQEGLPLGLVSSNIRFTDLTYFTSPAFWCWRSFKASSRKKFLLVSTILLAGLIAAFAGPSSALLLIPSTRTDWPGGATTFWLAGSESDLWPTTLDETYIGGPDCINPPMSVVNMAAPNTSSCIWTGQGPLLEYYRASHLQYGPSIMLHDDISSRALTVTLSTMSAAYVETWTLSSHVAAGLASLDIAANWWEAAWATNTGKNVNIKSSTRGGGVSTVASLLPAVRTKCSVYSMDAGWYTNIDSSTIEFPYLPEYDFENGTAYGIPQQAVANSSRVATWWYPIPSSPNQLSSGGTTTFYPSAFLFVAIPSGSASIPDAGYVCSIDARWGPGATVLSNLPQSTQTLSALLTDTRPSNESSEGAELGFRPVDDGSWQSVAITRAWLDVLAPNASATDQGYTTLAAMISAAGFDNSTGLLSSIYDNDVQLASVLATTFAEAMSRVGYAGNENPISWNDPLQLLGNEDAVRQPSGVSTPLRWSVQVTGYAYGANDVAHYLALTVLFTHMAMAVLHVGYLLGTRTVLRAWKSLEEMLVLSHESEPSRGSLRNTCAGIECHGTMRINVRIRALESGEKGAVASEEVHLLAEEDEKLAAFEKIEIGREYGAVGEETT